MVGVVMTWPSSAIGPGWSTFAVVNSHQMSLPVSLRLNETPIWLPWPTSGATLSGLDLAPVEQLADGARLEQGADVLAARSAAWPCGSMNWSWPVEPTRSRTCCLVADAGNLHHDPSRSVAGRLGSDLRLADADAGDATLDDVARQSPPARR